MKLFTIALVPTALIIAACGSSSSGAHAPVSDKQGAATAAYGLQNTNDTVRNRSGRGLSPAAELPGITDGNVDVSQTYTINGDQGTAEVTEKATVTGSDVSAEFTIKYHGFSLDGGDVLEGELTQIAHVSTSADGATVSTEVRGHVDVSGDLDSTLDVDVTTEVSASSSGASVTIDGHVIADGVNYQFDHDAFQLSNEPL